LKLLLVIKSLNVVGGGAERVLVDIANGMVERGHDVTVLTFDEPGRSFYALDARVRRIDTAIGKAGKPTPRLGFLRNALRIRKLVSQVGADLVVPFMHSAYVPLAAVLLGSGERLVFSEHTDATHYRTRPLQRALVRALDRLAIAKTVPSAPMREAHAPKERAKVHILPNAVKIGTFAAAAARPPREPLVVLCVGRFMVEKRHVDLIDAFARVAGAFPGWTLKLVGDGELRGELEAQVRALGLSERIRMPGATSDVVTEYAEASIVVLPSLYESFGLVAAEALASGRPLLAFDNCLGVADMVDSGTNGLLVAARPDRVANLAAGLTTLMRDPALRARLGAAGPAAVARFDLGVVLDMWERLFRDLLTQPQSAARRSNESAPAEKPGRAAFAAVPENRDDATIESFGDEWSAYTQADVSPQELESLFQTYFGIFPWERLPRGAVGFDMGCGSGRWARWVAPRVGHLHCIDPAAAALAVARRNLASCPNVSLHQATTQHAPLPPESCDFGYSLGVLHHIPDTERALFDCVRLLKPGAPFLVYLYYRFDNRPAWFQWIWACSNVARSAISRLPPRMKRFATAFAAVAVYWPVSRMSLLLEWVGADVSSMPLSFYRRSSLYTLLTDSRDRLGTPLERRFTRAEIAAMMHRAGLVDVNFSEAEPFWCAVGIKA